MANSNTDGSRKKKKPVRRGKNEGSIYLRNDGRWCAVVSLGYDNDGNRVRKNFYGTTRAEVAMKMTAALGEKLSGGHASVINDDLQTLIHEWLIIFKQANVSPRTFETVMYLAVIHIYPYIGGLKLMQVTPHIIQSLLNRMIVAGYSLAYVRKVKFLLNQFFAYAKANRFITDNPVSECIVKSTPEHKELKQEKYKAIPIEIREYFIEVISKNEFLKPLCLIQMFAGLRIGEVLALKWKNIDFDNGIISVTNAITSIPVRNSDGEIVDHRTVISDTKTAASVREVPIPNILKSALLEWKKCRWALQRKTGYLLIGPNELVFGNNDGSLRTYTGTKAIFERLMRQSGLAPYGIHFHALRHTYSSMLFESRENPKVIQMLLGHKDVTTTIRTYNSVDRSYFKQAVDKLDSKFNYDGN